MVYSLDPFAFSPRGIGSLCAGCTPQSGLGVVYSLDPFAYSPRGLGSLGLSAEHTTVIQNIFGKIRARGDDCNEYAKWADTYTRLSQKDKKKATLEAAKELAALCQQEYSACVSRKASTAVQQATGIAPAATVPAATVPVETGTTSTVLTPLLTAAGGVLQSIAQAPQSSPVQQTYAQPEPVPAESGWMTPKNMLIAGGAVLAIGVVIYLMRRK